MSGEVGVEQILEWTETLSNWGRWGNDDVLGTLNYITPDVRQRGLRAAKTGRSLSCAIGIDPSRPEMAPFARRYMLASGEGLEDEHRVGQKQPWVWTADELHFRVHGVATHLDALAHVVWKNRLYNGRPAALVSTASGATELGVEVASNGIVTRGVLLDVAAVRGVDTLDPTDDVFPEDLEAAEERQAVRVESGDAVLLSTGFQQYRRTKGWVSGGGQPCWHAACLPWLHEREVALIAHDAGGESLPTPHKTVAFPMHIVGIVAMGLWFIDHCDLTALASACAELGQWSFLFTVAPLPFAGATGCPVNPLAIL